MKLGHFNLLAPAAGRRVSEDWSVASQPRPETGGLAGMGCGSNLICYTRPSRATQRSTALAFVWGMTAAGSDTRCNRYCWMLRLAAVDARLLLLLQYLLQHQLCRLLRGQFQELAQVRLHTCPRKTCECSLTSSRGSGLHAPSSMQKRVHLSSFLL